MEQAVIDAQQLTSERIDEIGIKLITSYGSINIAADKLKIEPHTLRYWITITPELQVYHEIAQEGVKAMLDQQIIERLEAGDEDMIKLLTSKMYAGRQKGGFNVAEIGTIGYNDPLGKKIAAETEKDRAKGNITVNFNFVEKQLENKEVTIVEEYLEADESD